MDEPAELCKVVGVILLALQKLGEDFPKVFTQESHRHGGLVWD